MYPTYMQELASFVVEANVVEVDIVCQPVIVPFYKPLARPIHGVGLMAIVPRSIGLMRHLKRNANIANADPFQLGSVRREAMINEAAIEQNAVGNRVAVGNAHRLYIQPNSLTKRNPNHSTKRTHLSNRVANCNALYQPAITHNNRNADS